MTNDDLSWLEAERPAHLPLTPTATAHARTALLDRVAVGDVETPLLDDRRAGTGRQKRRGRRGARALVMAAAVVVALAVGFSVLLSGPQSEQVGASPLMRLSARVADEQVPAGDATLVVREQTGPGAPRQVGYDLSLDDGRYFYGSTPEELAAAVTGGAEQDGWLARVTTAAADAVELPIDEARTRMANAALDPSVGSESSRAPDEPVDPKIASAAPMDPTRHLEGNIWTNSLDALVLASGRPDVRAGVLRLLATCGDVTVVDGTKDGRPTLVLTARHFPDGYQEQLTIDASSGVPIELIGGSVGADPDIVMTYRSSRVTSTDLPRS